jgi:hypothetical protein
MNKVVYLYFDCFNNILEEGDDIVISINNKLHCGIVLECTNDYILIDYQSYKNGKEISHFKKITPDALNCYLSNIYKIK